MLPISIHYLIWGHNWPSFQNQQKRIYENVSSAWSIELDFLKSTVQYKNLNFDPKVQKIICAHTFYFNTFWKTFITKVIILESKNWLRSYRDLNSDRQIQSLKCSPLHHGTFRLGYFVSGNMPNLISGKLIFMKIQDIFHLTSVLLNSSSMNPKKIIDFHHSISSKCEHFRISYLNRFSFNYISSLSHKL